MSISVGCTFMQAYLQKIIWKLFCKWTLPMCTPLHPQYRWRQKYPNSQWCFLWFLISKKKKSPGRLQINPFRQFNTWSWVLCHTGFYRVNSLHWPFICSYCRDPLKSRRSIYLYFCHSASQTYSPKRFLLSSFLPPFTITWDMILFFISASRCYLQAHHSSFFFFFLTD